jgi:hypothetical protein
MFNQFNVEKKWYTYTDKITSVSGELLIDNNVDISGDLNVNSITTSTINATGAVGVDGNFDVATNKFTVASTSGNTAIAGTLDVTGNINSNDITTGNISAGGSINASGTINATNNITSNNIVQGNYFRFNASSTTWFEYVFDQSQHRIWQRGPYGYPGGRFKNDTLITGTLYYSGGSWPSSDDRIKSNEVSIDDAINIIKKLHPMKYLKHPDLITDEISPDLSGVKTFEEAGLIAQEIERDCPELNYLITENDGVKHVNYICIIPYLIKSIQELEQRIATLEAK